MNTIFVFVAFSIGLAVGIVATSSANRRAKRFGDRAELDAIRAEFMVYRSTAQDALASTQEDLDELWTHYTQLQTKLGEFKAQLCEPPTSFFSNEYPERHKLPLLKESVSNERTSTHEQVNTTPNQPTDYVQ